MTRFYTLTFLLLFCSAVLHSQAGKGGYASASVLSSGKWIRVGVISDGIYRLDFSLLRQKGLENPANPRVFCNNSGQLSYTNNGTSPDDLSETAVYLNKGSDGIFNEGDYLLFYGRGTGRWQYDPVSFTYKYLKHNYCDTSYYYITSGNTIPAQVNNGVQPAPSAYVSSQSDVLFIREVETVNLLGSGRDWFEPVSSSGGISVNPGFSDLVPLEKIKFRMRVAARSSSSTKLKLYEGQNLVEEASLQAVNIFNTTGTYAQTADSTGAFLPSASFSGVEVRFSDNGDAGARGWLDYLTLHARVNTAYKGQFRQFSDYRSVAAGRITTFSIKCQQENVMVWDVTDPLRPVNLSLTRNGENIEFRSGTDSLKTFACFQYANTLVPQVIKDVSNQDLHGSAPADMVIITHPLFRQYAEELAGIHLTSNGMTTLVVTPGQVYNEFSGGTPDIAALRNFIRMKYLKQKDTSKPLKYLLLFGDGSYENRTPPPGNPNYIPTYQSQNSTVVTSSFTSDDFYGLLEDGEGEADGTEDIGIGRLPVSDTAEAGAVLSKIRKYLDHANMGDWRNIICLTADDEDGNSHMSDAEGLDMVLREEVPEVNIEKIYLDAFRQTTSVNGQSYPEVTRAVNDRINAGCLIFNYVGHGSESGLAHERIVKTDDINSWKNGGKLPLFVTATCEFSRFDGIEINLATREISEKKSAGEMVLLNRNGGAIALMSTTRVVFSAPNFFLNRNIFSCAFDRDSSGNPLALGDIIRVAKNNSGNGSNKRNFSLLGDPALALAYPWHGRVVTDSVNNSALAAGTDSLKALSVITVAGHIEDRKGQILNNFNGVVSPLVYDKENRIRTLANDGGPVMEFLMRNNILFSGNTTARNGRFRFSFIVPRDINYSYGNGKISYYAHNEDEDMNGFLGNIIVGGFSNAGISDSEGPDIRLFMNDTLFRNGGMTDMNPILLALINDNGGINTTGSGIGHDLTGYLDGDRNHSFALNSYYTNDFDSYMKGKVTYNLSGLDEGSHTFTLKAWDNYNNSSEKTIRFVVESDGKLMIKDLLSYPNPFRESTRITAGVNRPGEELDVELRIFSLSGRLVRVIHTVVAPSGYTIPPVVWDGNDDGGNRVARGLYPYVVTVRTREGETARASGRLIIL